MPKTSPRVLISAEEIRRRTAQLGQQIAVDYPGGELCLVGVLKGACVFLADLVRAIPRPVRFDFISASSYGSGTTSSGAVKLTMDVAMPVEGVDVLVVEDIVDTGITLDYLLRSLAGHNPKSLRVVALLDKPERHEVTVPIDYLGFTIPNQFVIGYGMDYDENYRDLRDVCVLEE